MDEACQCSELAALAPLVLNPKRVVLVGDHKQLPATIFSDNKENTLFERSLFERLHSAGIKIYTLKVQYRMHSIIRAFPSLHFYENKLEDHKSVSERENIEEYPEF